MKSDAPGARLVRSDIESLWPAQDPFQGAQNQNGIIYRDKEGRRTLRFEFNGRGFFLKLHQGVGWREIFKNLAQGRLPVLGAENEYRAIRALEKLNLDTLCVAAYGKRGLNPATQLSFLVTDELQNVESLEDLCARWPQQPPDFSLKLKLIERVATIARTLHENGINHRDFYLCHFLLEGGTQPLAADNLDARKLYLMDLHRAQIRARVPRRWLIKDLGGLYYSALDIGLTPRDIFRFLRAYTQQPLRNILQQDLIFWSAVRARARRIYVRDHRREPQSAAWLSRTPTLDAFLHGDRNLNLPATLALVIDDCEKELSINKVLRLLPRKRLVVKAQLDARAVVVKIFVRSRSSKRHIERERAGFERIASTDVHCAKLLHTFTTRCGRFEGVIYEFIDAPALSVCWEQFNELEKQRWLQRITHAMLTMHRSGAYQSDIHADNFLIKDNDIYLLDLGSIVLHHTPLPRSQCIDNLGALIAQFYFSERKLFTFAINDYCQQRNWTDTKVFTRKLQQAIDQNWQKRKLDYLDKALRDCKLTVFKKSFDKVVAIRRDVISAELLPLCENPEAAMITGTLLKAGNTATVVSTHIGNRPVVIKRYNIKNWRHAISRALRPTRAEHSWLFAHWLELAGIDSIKPIALIENRWGWWRKTAYFIGEQIQAPDLLSTGRERELAPTELNHLQTLLEAMRAGHLSHGDFKANNLLLCENSVALIDLDAMHEHKTENSWRRAFKRDLARLQRNWPEDRKVSQQIKLVIDAEIAAIDQS